ncbi:MAG TPA: DUF3472 domain-containing protein, partial [Chitinophagaceae bacterium]|nr:DUF3472 domain-containing protein [Chitinophagaceae bacterium]
MKTYCFAVLLSCLTTIANATVKDSTILYSLPDSVKAVQFMAEINVQSVSEKKAGWTGIRTDAGTLALVTGKAGKKVIFECYGEATPVTTGLKSLAMKKGEIVFDYEWQLNETYKLLIATASDSAENFSLYSGYIFLPKENKWKLIGTYRISGRWNTIQAPGSFSSGGRKSSVQSSIGQVWCQRNTGSWKNMKTDAQTPPVVNLSGH